MIKNNLAIISQNLVTELNTLNVSETYFDLTWTNPPSSNYDNIILNYIIIEISQNKSVTLAKGTSTYQIDGLLPGCTVDFSFSTKKDGNVIATTENTRQNTG